MPDPRPPHRRWPLVQVMVVENRRILYVPIAKNACSSLKRLAVSLSDLPARDAMLAGDIHDATDHGRSGILLRDHEREAAERMLAARGWFRFAVIREPVDRLVSAYLEKFVKNRLEERNLEITMPVMRSAHGGARPCPETGISFRDFVEAILNTMPRLLNPHWCAQSAYFEGVPVDRLYTTEDLDLLGRDLSEWTGAPVVIGHQNRSRSEERRHLPDVADLLACDFEPAHFAASVGSFCDDAMRARLERKFPLDFALYAATATASAHRRGTISTADSLDAQRRAALAEAAAAQAQAAAARAEVSHLRAALEEARRPIKWHTLNGLRRIAGLPAYRRGRRGAGG